MSTTFYDPGVGDHVIIDGSIVERQSLYLVEKIQDLYPNVVVLAVDPDMADSPWEEPYQICEWSNGRLLKIFGVWELNDSVIERLHLADHTKHDIQQLIDDTNAKVKSEEKRIREDRAGERKDLLASVAANRTSTFSYRRESDDELITFHEDRPATKGKSEKVV